MTINSISTYGSLQSFLQNINITQNSLNSDQVQISSGRVSDTFDGLNGSVEQFISLTAQVTRMQNYHQGNSVVTSQLQTINTSINQMLQTANSLKSLVVTQLSGTSNSASFVQQVRSSRDAFVGQLNSNYQGSYIFGGTNTNTAPVNNPPTAPLEAGAPDAGYYQGSKQNISFRIADSQSVENTIRADDPAFQNILAAISLVSSGSANTDDLKNAENLIDAGISGLIGLQSTANANMVRVQQVDTQSETVRTYYQSLSEDMSKSDVIALTTKVTQDQSILQASFSTFARISSLSLANYLK